MNEAWLGLRLHGQLFPIVRLARLVLVFVGTLSIIGCGAAKAPQPAEIPDNTQTNTQTVETPESPQSDPGQLRPVRFVLPTPDDSNRPHQVLEKGYVSSKDCQSCHPEAYSSWHASYHRTMTQLATPESVRGDFGDAVTNYYGTEQRFFREGDQFKAEMLVTMPGEPSGQGTQPTSRSARVEMPVALVTGSHHTQVYWYATGQGRLLDMVPFFYLLGEQRWVPRNAAFLRPGGPDRNDEWESWNQRCIRCHSTHGRPRYDNAYDTEVVEFGISCEACHGPAHDHVEANESSAKGTIVTPNQLSPRAASQTCGQCHSVWRFANDEEWDHWNAHGARFRPGDELTDTRLVLIPSQTSPNQRSPEPRSPASDEAEAAFLEGTFWSDGMVRVTGREYNGLVDSPCFQRGELSCLSCHTMHQPADDPRPVSEWANDQLKLKMDGNLACTQCHAEYGASERLVSHTNHSAASAGSQCYNCHMPHTTYGLLKATRSHQIDSPNAATSVTTGRPNACNLCHLDQSLKWTAAHLNRWYGIEQPKLSVDQQNVAAGPLWLLSGDAGQRALIAWSMNWPPAQEASGTEWMPRFLAETLVDPYPAVRLLGHRALRKRPGYETLEYDYVGTNASQKLASLATLEIWRRQDRASADWSDAVARAIVDLSRLAGMRDDRSMFLLE